MERMPSPSSEDEWLWLDDIKTEEKSTRRQPSAKRQNEEMVCLRKQIKTMEGTLQSLKLQRREEVEAHANVVAVGVWEGVIKRQRDLRAQEELENAKLRTTLKTKIKAAKSLIKLIKKAICSEARGFNGQEGSESLYPTSKHARFAPNRHSRASKSAFLSCMKTLYQQQALAFPVDRFDTSSLTFHDIQVTDKGADGMSIDVSARWMARFPIDQVLRVLWEATVAVLQEKLENLVLNAHDSADLLSASYNVRVQTLGKSFAEEFQGAMMMQRCPSTQDAPAVIVSSKCAETLSSTSSAGASFNELSWLRVRETTTSSTTMTQVQISRCIQIRFDGGSDAMLLTSVGAMTAFLMNLVENELKWRQNAIESVLLIKRRG